MDDDKLPRPTPGGIAGFILALVIAMVAPFIIDGGFVA
jgi:hypothetical protein